MGKTDPLTASHRFIETIEAYKQRLQTVPDLKFKTFCDDIHADYRQILDWANHHGMGVAKLRKTAQDHPASIPSPVPESPFVQFVPSVREKASSLRGVSITFPDGVNLTLQESSADDVINLLTIYRMRQGGAKLCSD